MFVAPAREVLLSDVSGVAQVRVAVPSTVTLNLGASLDLACCLRERALPVTLVFVIGARQTLVELTTARP